jgi:hypothetical protein
MPGKTNRDEAMAEYDAWWAATEKALTRERRVQLLWATIGLVAEHHPQETAELCAAALEELRGDWPTPVPLMFENLRREAAFWADTARPPELEAYVAAGLQQMGQTAFAAATRKRLFVMLWQSFPPDFQAAFLGRVDPAGQFRGAA